MRGTRCRKAGQWQSGPYSVSAGPGPRRISSIARPYERASRSASLCRIVLELSAGIACLLKPDSLQVSVSVSSAVPVPPADGANFFHFTVVGSEIQLLVGTINLLRFLEAKQSGEPTNLVPEITHRFLLSPLGFAQLKSQIEQITPSVPSAGIGIHVGKK